MDKISIIVPVYNVSEYLPQCIDSLLRQTYEETEIICVNDGSTDNSLSILQKYAEESDRVHIINQDNRGVSEARNRGLSVATGDWIMFVDSDDWIDAETCEIMLKTVTEYKAQAVMCAYIKEYRDRSEIVQVLDSKNADIYRQNVQKFHRRLYGPVGVETSNPLDLDIVITPVMQLFKKDLVEGIEFKDIRRIGTFEDGLFQIDVYARCKSFVYISNPFYHYRKTNNSSITTKYKKELYRQREYLFDLMENNIKENDYDKEYTIGLKNRVAFDLIGIAINEARSKDNVIKKAAKIKTILNTQRRRDALEELETTYMPWKWKVFYSFMKKKRTYLIMSLLDMLVFLHDHNQ